MPSAFTASGLNSEDFGLWDLVGEYLQGFSLLHKLEA